MSVLGQRKRLGAFYDVRDERAGQFVDSLPLMSVSQVYGVVPRSELSGDDGRAETLVNYKVCEPGDIVLNRMSAYNGALGVARQRGLVSPDYLVMQPREGVNADFVVAWLKTPRGIYEMTSRLRGIGSAEAAQVRTPRINNSDLRLIPIEAPLPEEQRTIADYLDRETARIDTLIEEQQRLIEMLRERRGAAISSAVAQGLDETVSLKDSGLPGAGPVPTHWEVMPLRYTILFQEGPGIMAVDFRDEGIPLLRVSCVRAAQSTLEGCNYLDPDEVNRRWSHFRVDRGDLLISASASMGTVSEVTEETAGAVPYTGIIRIKPGRMHKDFIRWFVVSGEFIDQVDSLKTGSTIQHFGPTHLAQMRVALPPTDEQHQIAAYLDEQTAKNDTLIEESERLIELSKERRSALITAAVTGQIDVREMV